MSEVKQLRAWNYANGDTHVLTVSYEIRELTPKLTRALEARVNQMVPPGYVILDRPATDDGMQVDLKGSRFEVTFALHVQREQVTGLPAGSLSEAGFTMDPMQTAH